MRDVLIDFFPGVVYLFTVTFAIAWLTRHDCMRVIKFLLAVAVAVLVLSVYGYIVDDFDVSRAMNMSFGSIALLSIAFGGIGWALGRHIRK
ncbi:MAG: hypothetical protein AAFV31_06335 [Pseudomonadota bacterium]